MTFTPDDYLSVILKFPLIFTPTQLEKILQKCQYAMENQRGGTIAIEFGGGSPRKMTFSSAESIAEN